MAIDTSNSVKIANKEIINFLNQKKKASSNFSSFELNEFNGIGQVKYGTVFPGVYLRVFDLHLKEDLTLTKDYFSLSSLNFILIHKGYYIYKNGRGNKPQKVSIDHVFNNSKLTSNSEITIPHSTPTKIVLLSIDIDKFKIHSLNDSFKEHLKDSGISKLKKDHINSGVDKIKLFEYINELIKTNFLSTSIIEIFKVRGIVLKLIALYLSYYKFQESSLINKEECLINKMCLRFKGVIDMIHSEVSENISINDISRNTNLNRNILQDFSQTLLGLSIKKFIMAVRMEKARTLLQHTDRTISEICYEVGLSSRSYFSNAFKKTYGCHPSEFRGINKETDTIYEIYYTMNIHNKLSLPERKELIDQIQHINSTHELSGILLFDDHRLFHFLEGNSETIQKFYHNQVLHKKSDCTIIKKSYRKNRRFYDWSATCIQDKNNYPFNFIYDFEYMSKPSNPENLFTIETYIQIAYNYISNLKSIPKS